jgi:uncharacterized membrane protein YfcA
MATETVLYLGAMIFVAALLYSSVGHGGASGYLAAMALFGLAPEEMKPAALTLNILVSSISVIKYTRAGCFSWKVFWPFAVASVPFAFLGGLLTLPGIYYAPLVGAALLFAAWRFMFNTAAAAYIVRRPPLPGVLASGAGLGFLSGLTGVGGGIFLSPLLIFLRWAEIKQVSGIAAAFILVNSTAGLLGFVVNGTARLPDGLPLWAIAAAAGGIVGAEYGSKHLNDPVIKRLLGIVLFIAGVKMIAVVF